MKSSLTKSQRKILDYVTAYIEDKGHSPTFREIQSHFRFASLGSVYNYVTILKKKGLLLDQKRSSISLQIEEKVQTTDLLLPLMGTLAAGFPIETFPQSQFISVPRSLVQNPDDTYLMRVKGDTLIYDHIIDGDLLLIEPRSEAQEGELIVASIDQNETIVKRYFPEGPYIRLESSDSRHEPIILNAQELIIHGVIVGLMREYI